MWIGTARLGVIVVAVMLLLTGCGSGGSAKTVGTPGTTTTARAVADPELRYLAENQVEVRWEAPAEIPQSDIEEYHVLRNEVVVGVTSRNQRYFFDFDKTRTTLVYNRLNASGSLSEMLIIVPRFPLGKTRRYGIRAVYKTGEKSYAQTLLPESGRVTLLTRPVVSEKVSAQDLNRVRVSFDRVEGANQYIVEFASERSFANKVKRGPFRISNNENSETIPLLNIRRDFLNVQPGQRIYFRVGARNSADELAPLSRGTPNGDAFIYSGEERFFQK